MWPQLAIGDVVVFGESKRCRREPIGPVAVELIGVMPLTTAARGSEKYAVGEILPVGLSQKGIGEIRWRRCTFWLCLPGSPAKVNPLDGSESFFIAAYTSVWPQQHFENFNLAYRPIWAGVTKTFEQISWLPDVGQT